MYIKSVMQPINRRRFIGVLGGMPFTLAPLLAVSLDCAFTTHAKECPSDLPKPTHAEVPYGTNERNVLDAWLATSERPTPLVFIIHGGGWSNGSKEYAPYVADIQQLLDVGIKRGLQVDFVAVHYYKADLTPQQMIAWLKAIHNRTGRPLWVTEWNNGAPWVRGHNPSLDENAKKVYDYSSAMNDEPWNERYAIHAMGDGRELIDRGVLTPVGEAHKMVTGVEACTGCWRS